MSTPTRSLIDTAALRRNLARVRELAPRSRVMAVIKANGYGHGLEAVATALDGAEGLAVARLEEALALRAAGRAGRILLLEGVTDAAQLEVAVRAGLDLMLHCPEQLALLESGTGAGSLRAWIKIDTGMNRLGFRVEDVPAVLRRVAAIARVAPHPVLASHFASADETGNPQTAAQLEAFAAVTRGLPGERSLANSAGVLAWPDARTDWVRPGLMLYGISPFAEGSGADLGLSPVMTFESRVIAVKRVPAGETVGYGGEWRAGRETALAIVAAGYGDGYPRSARSGTPVRIGDGTGRLAGRVSMDMIAVDVTELPPVAVGDRVELWGPSLPVEEVARWAGTIPYVLTCAVSQRVPRLAR